MAAGLSKTPEEIRAMPGPHAFSIFEYWRTTPPVNETLAMLARIYTTWKPDEKPMTPEEHMASLEQKWKSGEAMNIKQVFEAMGGKLGSDPSLSRSGQTFDDTLGPDMGGVGRFPGHRPKPKPIDDQAEK